jgi:serine/threonine protein phosphatase PrpC
MEIKSYGDSVKGKEHSENEDFLLFDDEKRLYAVADGVTIPHGGGICSKKAIIYLKKYFKTDLQKAFLQTSKKIFRERSLHSHIGFSTLTALHISLEDKPKAIFAHVGDSSAYIIKKNQIEKITIDHSTNNVLYQAIGIKDLEPQFAEKNLKERCFIILCTDGVSNAFKISEIYKIVKKERDVLKVTNALIERAESRLTTYSDDKTVVCVEFKPD